MGVLVYLRGIEFETLDTDGGSNFIHLLLVEKDGKTFKESQKKSPSQQNQMFDSQLKCNRTHTPVSSLNFPQILLTKEKKSNRIDFAEHNLYDHVQSTPLLSTESSAKKVTMPPHLHQEFLKENNDWTWKSLDNIAAEQSNCRNPRIYATRVDRTYTMYRKDVFYSGSIYNLKTSDDDKAVTEHIALENSPHNPKNQNPSEMVEENYKEYKSIKILRKILDIISEMTSLSLFMDPLFLIFALSCTLTMFGKCTALSHTGYGFFFFLF